MESKAAGTDLDSVVGGQSQQTAAVGRPCRPQEVAVQRSLAEATGAAGPAHKGRAGKRARASGVF